MGTAGNAATARALNGAGPSATSFAATAQDQQGNASVAALLGQPAPAAPSDGGQQKKPGLLDKFLDPIGTAKTFVADKAWALLRRYAPDLVPILKQGVGAWLTGQLANAMRWLLGMLTAPVTAVTGVADALRKQFGRLVGWMRAGLPKLVSTACKKISDGSEDVVKVVDGIEAAEDKGIAKLKDLASSAGDFLGGLWDDLGAPVAKLLGNIGSSAWQKIQQVAQWLWDKTQPIRDLGAQAWHWLKNIIGIGEGSEGRNGIIQWVQARAQGAWDWIKSKLGGLPTPLKVAGGALLALSPAGPVLAAGALAYGVVKGAKWLWANLSDPDALVRLRHSLVDDVLPELRSGVGKVKGAIKAGVDWLTSTLTDLGVGLRGLAGALTAPIVAPLLELVGWLRERHEEFVRWVDEHARPLADLVTSALDRLRWLSGQLLTVLKKVITVVVNPFGIGGLVMGTAWRSLPACMRSAILKFLLRLVQGALRLMRVPTLGPLGEVLRQAMIGFVDRALEEKNLAQLEQIANRFSRLATRGSWDFTAGYGIGLLKGIWDGIAGPFLLLVDIGKLVQNAVAWVRDLVLTSLTDRGRAVVREIRTTWNEITTQIKPAVAAFLKGPTSLQRILKFIDGVVRQIVSTARNAGARVFDELMTYLKQPDRKLGESIGFVTGNIVFEVTLTVLTAGGYAVKPVIQRVSRMFTKIMSKVGDLLKELRTIVPKIKNVLDKVTDLAGKNKTVKGLVDDIKRFIDKLMELLGLSRRTPDKKPGKTQKDDHDPKDKDDDGHPDIDLSRVRATFRTDDGNTHTLRFRSSRSAELMVNSTPTPVKRLVAFGYIAKHDTDLGSISTDARKKLDEIKGKIKKFRKKPTHAGHAALAELYADLQKEVQLLGAQYLRIIMAIPESKPPRWQDPTSPRRFGTRMVACQLTNKHPVGSRPDDNATPTWQHILRRRAKRKGTRYVQGHLLSEKLGGPGDAKNLSPITRRANRRHESAVEKTIKRMVHKEGKGVWYEVEAIYGRPPITSAKKKSYWKQWSRRGMSVADIKDLMNIVVAESDMPIEFRWKYHVVWDDGVFGKGQEYSGVVPNELDQKAGSYKLRS